MDGEVKQEVIHLGRARPAKPALHSVSLWPGVIWIDFPVLFFFAYHTPKADTQLRTLISDDPGEKALLTLIAFKCEAVLCLQKHTTQGF